MLNNLKILLRAVSTHPVRVGDTPHLASRHSSILNLSVDCLDNQVVATKSVQLGTGLRQILADTLDAAARANVVLSWEPAGGLGSRTSSIFGRRAWYNWIAASRAGRARGNSSGRPRASRAGWYGNTASISRQHGIGRATRDALQHESCRTRCDAALAPLETLSTVA